MERLSWLVHPDACVSPVVLVARPQSRLNFHTQQSAEISLRVQCRINRIEQSCVAEWLEQALDRTLFE